MTDSEKLCLLADWVDKKYPNDCVPEIQEDLRRIAAQLAESTNSTHKSDLMITKVDVGAFRDSYEVACKLNEVIDVVNALKAGSAKHKTTKSIVCDNSPCEYCTRSGYQCDTCKCYSKFTGRKLTTAC